MKTKKVLLWIFFYSFLLPGNIFSQKLNFRNGIIYSELIKNPSIPLEENKATVNVLFKTPINNTFPGLQKEMVFDFCIPLDNSTTGGIFFFNQSAGILTRQLFLMNFSKDIKFKSNFHINTGLSFGFQDYVLNQEALSQQIINGNTIDPVVLAYQSKPPTFYNTLGMTIYSSKIDFQVIIPNLSSYVENSNNSTFENKPIYLGVGYCFPYNPKLSNGINNSIKFQLSYIKNNIYYIEKNTISIGASMFTTQGLMFELFYNTIGTINSGFGIDLSDKCTFNVNYIIGGKNSSNILGSNGQTIVGLSLKLFKTKTK